MNKEIIKTLKDIDKYYSLDYLITLTNEVSKIFTKCDVDNYLRAHAKSFMQERGMDLIKKLPTCEQIRLTMGNKNSEEFKKYVDVVEDEVVESLAELYKEFFNKIKNNRDTVRDNIDAFDKDKLCEFEAVAEWLLMIYNNTTYTSFRSSMSSNSIKKFFELKQYFIYEYSYECWLAYEVICLNNYFRFYKECSDADKKRFKILQSISKVVKPKNFNKVFYSKSY